MEQTWPKPGELGMGSNTWRYENYLRDRERFIDVFRDLAGSLEREGWDPFADRGPMDVDTLSETTASLVSLMHSGLYNAAGYLRTMVATAGAVDAVRAHPDAAQIQSMFDRLLLNADDLATRPTSKKALLDLRETLDNIKRAQAGEHVRSF